MRVDLDENWVRLIWNHSILPYIEEQLFAEPELLTEYRLEALRKSESADGTPDTHAD